jgi:alpha-L-rhamnosidase
MTKITNLACEYRTNPLGIDVVQPRFSWQLQTDRRGARQQAYRVLVASQPEKLQQGGADFWDSGQVDSDQSVHVAYEGQTVGSRQRLYWKVMVWDETQNLSESDIAWFEMGLLDADDWGAQWIGAALTGGPRTTIPAPYLNKSFTVPGAVQSARLYVTALGLYECSINGVPVSEDVFAPGWTEYKKRVQYQVYDVTEMLQEGENRVGAILGDGWAVGHVGWDHRQQYIDRPRLLAQLEIKMSDGSTIVIASDETWKYQFGPLLENDLMMGEAYDARLELEGWGTSHVDDTKWLNVEVFPAPDSALVATNGPVVRRIDELKPIADPVDKSNFDRIRFIFDLGQNMVGWIRFEGVAPAGTTVGFRFSEVLNPDGTLYTENLRSARATDFYTFKGTGKEVWEPKFTFHGFRYVELSGYRDEITRETITGIALHSDMAVTGEFECSDPVINQLQSNILWGQKGNFVDVPTDCPQRDERLGWTGDIQVFVRTAAFNMDVAGFMTKWAQDLADSQDKEGRVPPVVPKMKTSFMEDGGPAWADAAIICPWTIYTSYGDKRILENNYPTMRKFMDFIVRESPALIRCAPGYDGWLGFGDWLSINADTPRDLIGTAFLAYDANLMAQIAEVVGKPEDAEYYRQLFADVKDAFGNRFLKGGELVAVAESASEVHQMVEHGDAISRGNLKVVDYGPVDSEVFNTDFFQPTQTAYALALHFDLLPEELRPIAAAELVADIERRDLHLSTGFVGTPYISHVLSSNGQLEYLSCAEQQRAA